MLPIGFIAAGSIIIGIGGAFIKKKRKQRPFIKLLLPQESTNKTQTLKLYLTETSADFSERITNIDDAYQHFIQTRFDPLFGKRAHLDFISDKQIVKSNMEKAVNRSMALAGISLGLVTVGTVLFSPVQWLAIPVMLYGNKPLFMRAYEALFIDRRLTEEILGSLLLVGWIVGGYLFLGVLVLFSGVLWQKLLMLTRDSSEHTLVDLFGQ